MQNLRPTTATALTYAAVRPIDAPAFVVPIVRSVEVVWTENGWRATA